jgi:hypothetical protein
LSPAFSLPTHLPTDFQGLSFTSPQAIALLYRTPTLLVGHQNGRDTTKSTNKTNQLLAVKRKNARVKTTQAFWLLFAIRQ